MMMDKSNTVIRKSTSGPFVGNPNATSPRFNQWIAFFICSLIVVGSCIEATDRVQPSKSAVNNQRWAVGCSTTTFIISFAVAILHMKPIGTIFIVNTKLEGALILLLTILWFSLAFVITGAGNGLAVARDGSVIFGNLYYFTWIGFILLCAIIISYVKTVHFIEINEELANRRDRMTLWILQMIANILLLASAANIYDHSCVEQDPGSKFCKRSILAMANGFVGSALSIILVGINISSGRSSWLVETIFSTIMFFLNAVCIGMVTSELGPGAKVGNVFYFSWGTIVLSFVLMSANYDDYHYARQKKEEQADIFLAAQGEQEGDFGSFSYLDDERAVLKETVYTPPEVGLENSSITGSENGNDESRSRVSQRSVTFVLAQSEGGGTIDDNEHTPNGGTMV